MGPNVATALCEQLLAIMKKKHECQEPDELSGDSEIADDEFAEYDWAVIESAMDCLVGIAKAIAGNDFAQHVWPKFQKIILKYSGSSESAERAQATGTLAECILAMGDGVTPYTEQLMKVVMHKFRDEDEVVKGNAIYAAGIMSQYSGNADYIIQQYRAILEKLEPLLEDQGEGKEHLLDNAVGCVARMIIGHPDHLPLKEVLPIVLANTPAKEDYEINGPVLKCLLGLCKFFLRCSEEC
jgi:importin-4